MSRRADAHTPRSIWFGRTSVTSRCSGEPLAESWIAVNPKDPNNMIVSAVAKGGRETQVYSTRDGGRTWTRARFAKGGGGGGGGGGVDVDKGGDAVVYFDETGIGYAVSLAGECAAGARSTATAR